MRHVSSFTHITKPFMGKHVQVMQAMHIGVVCDASAVPVLDAMSE